MDSRPGDETLLAAVVDRDMGAFRALYERHAGWLAIRLARRYNDRDLVADAVQDTLVAVWQKPKGFRGDGDIAAWLWGIAIRRLVSRMRTRGSVAAVFGNAGAAPAAEDQVLLSVEYGDIGQALARLSPEMRAVIQAVVLDGLSAGARESWKSLGRWAGSPAHAEHGPHDRGAGNRGRYLLLPVPRALRAGGQAGQRPRRDPIRADPPRRAPGRGRPPMSGGTKVRRHEQAPYLDRWRRKTKVSRPEGSNRGESMSPKISAGTGQLTSSRPAPVTRPSPPAPARGWRLTRRIGETPARAAFVIMIALLAGCSSSAPTSPDATPSSATPTQTSPTAASTSPAARTFTSRHYGYTGALPAGWSSGAQATQKWNGQGAPGDEDNVVDLFSGPGGVEAWAMAAPTRQTLTAYTAATTRASAAAHPCPATPQTDQAITIGAEPARLLTMQCPAGSGFLVEIATTIHDGTAYVFTSQNPTGSGNPSADRAAFRTFLAGIQLQR